MERGRDRDEGETVAGRAGARERERGERESAHEVPPGENSPACPEGEDLHMYRCRKRARVEGKRETVARRLTCCRVMEWMQDD